MYAVMFNTQVGIMQKAHTVAKQGDSLHFSTEVKGILGRLECVYYMQGK